MLPAGEKISIVKAHAIQNNRILNKIGEAGMVVTMDGITIKNRYKLMLPVSNMKRCLRRGYNLQE